MQQLAIGEHWISYIGPLHVHMDTLVMMWTAMIIVAIVGFIIARNLNKKPSKLQTFGEMIMEFTSGLAIGQIGPNGKKHVTLISSLFLFILTANLVGQIPLKLMHLHEGELASPTNDINVTLGLALVVSIYYICSGVAEKGFGYITSYFKPMIFMAPMNLLEDFTRPLSLSLRLFANITAGEVIIAVILAIIPKFCFFIPIPFMLFELFVAFIQAFIFAILAASYIGAATSEEH